METFSANLLVLGPLLWTLYCQKNFSAAAAAALPVPEEVPEMLETLEHAEIVRRRRVVFGVRGRQLSLELSDEPVNVGQYQAEVFFKTLVP